MEEAAAGTAVVQVEEVPHKEVAAVGEEHKADFVEWKAQGLPY